MAWVKACVLALLLAAAQSKNPEYDRWAGCKVGSWVKFRMENTDKDGTLVLLFTYTLKDLTLEKAVLELKTSSEGKADDIDKEEIPSGRDVHPLKVEAEGDEEVEVAGKKLKSHWVKGMQGKKLKVKFWYAGEVPGALIKAEIDPGDGSLMKMITTGWKKD